MFQTSPAVCRIFPLPEVSAQSQLKILTPCTMLGSGCLHELNPCSLFICSHLFLVTEARNGCVVGLGVSTNAGGYFYSVFLQSALRKHLLNLALTKKVYIMERMMRWQYSSYKQCVRWIYSNGGKTGLRIYNLQCH